MAAHRRGSVKVLVQRPNASFKAIATLAFSSRLVEFAERAEGIKDVQRKREQQLEQPPDAGDATSGSSSSSS
ncbi:hypothetical protein Airi02_013080 [Actinoallomurus iriomotensis]|uniref:Uncharacterized protein n=1 Tax=Actinoallomurus iriomotensis TaxID=478107 RepID=A0A9W6VSH8_9ACTN|nr:hypothetical protein Airi02_013080 [Actinoallomurus iriomotensis]